MQTLSPRERFGFQFATVSRRWRRELDHRMAAAGYREISWAPLIHLDEGGDGLSQKALALRVGMESSSLVRHLDRLESRGHIRREGDARDRRTKRVYLTPAGRVAVGEVRRALHAAETEMLAEIGEAELEAVLDALEAIRRALPAGAEDIP